MFFKILNWLISIYYTQKINNKANNKLTNLILKNYKMTHICIKKFIYKYIDENAYTLKWKTLINKNQRNTILPINNEILRYL